MSTTTILGILFVLELVIVGFGLATFLYMKLRKLNRLLAAKEAKQKTASGNTLHDLFEEKITQTREKIALKYPHQTEQEHEAEKVLLNQRIGYLELEKDLLDEHTDETNIWNSIFSRLSSIFSAGPDTHSDIEGDSGGPNNSSLRRRLSKYKKLLGKIIQEFRDYRNNARKLADALVDQSDDAKQSASIKRSLAEFNQHDEQTRQRLEEYQQEIATDAETMHAQHVTSGAQQKVDFAPAKASEEEIKRLQAIIGRQYDSLDELKRELLSGDSPDSGELFKKLEQVEKSQKELQTCVEVLEMENQRLSDELNRAQQQLDAGDNGEAEALQTRNSELEEQLSESMEKLQGLEKDYNSLQQEFMRIYEKNKE